MEIEIPIIPIEQTFYKGSLEKKVNWEIDSYNTLDLPAIISFLALGFMLDDDTYYSEINYTQILVDIKQVVGGFEAG